MNKLVATFSSVAVCVSAVAVSVLSYFSHPVETNAAAPDTSSLVTTSLSSSGTYPSICLPKNFLVTSTYDFDYYVYMCPTGWSTPSSYNYLTPSSYGTYSPSFYSFFRLSWSYSLKRFYVVFGFSFDSNLAGKKIFSNLHFSNIWGNGGLDSRDFNLVVTCPFNSVYTNSYTIYGSSFDPSALTNNVEFTLKGLIGNDYDLYLSSLAYNEGNADGHNEGYQVGFDEGLDLGYSSGYSVGIHDASSQFGMWDLFSNAFTSVGNVLGIQIFPGFTVGLLISVPIAFAFILWLIHVLKG